MRLFFPCLDCKVEFVLGKHAKNCCVNRCCVNSASPLGLFGPKLQRLRCPAEISLCSICILLLHLSCRSFPYHSALVMSSPPSSSWLANVSFLQPSPRCAGYYQRPNSELAD